MEKKSPLWVKLAWLVVAELVRALSRQFLR